jgi:hypothetical protein
VPTVEEVLKVKAGLMLRAIPIAVSPESSNFALKNTERPF